MTPQEKAKELYEKFIIYTDVDIQNSKVEIYNTKQCALIAVDEIISELEDIMNFTGNKLSLKLIKYWKEVKIEIEKL